MNPLRLRTLDGIRPRRFGLASWSAHVAFAFDLVADLRPRLLVELGTHHGESYFAFCQARRESAAPTVCHAVDTWEGDHQTGFYSEDVYEAVRAHNEEFYADFSFLVRARFEEAADRFADGTVDLLHFDGLHTYEAARQDFEHWRPKLSPRGIALFHDIAARHDDFGVWRLWDELRGEGRAFAFHHGWGLGVWQPADGAPTGSPLLETLFGASEADAENIRRYYGLATDALRLHAATAENARLRDTLRTAGARPDGRREARNEDPSQAESEVRELLASRQEHWRGEKAWRDEIACLHDEINALHARLGRSEADSGRLRDLRRSLSWRLTLPLRALSRWLGSRNVQPAPGSAASALPAGGYRFHLDEPTDWNLSATGVNVRGWCLPPADSDAEVPALRLRCGAAVRDIECGFARPDVLAFHSAPARWWRCGFEVRLTLPPGPSEVFVEAVEADGGTTPLGRFSARAPYVAHGPGGAGGDPTRDYEVWVACFDTLSGADRRRLRALARTLERTPLFSVVMPVYNPPEAWLVKAIESVQGQFYERWELCIADDASTAPHVRETLRRYERSDPRIKVVCRPTNGGIAAASNSALELATGEYVALLDHDDELALQALYEAAALLARQPDLQMLYTDEDKLDDAGRRSSPYFKPDWNYDLFLGQNLFNHLGVFRRDLMEKVGGFRAGYEGAQDYDLVLRCLDHVRPAEIGHVPQVLYHWRAIPGSAAASVDEKSHAGDAARRALREHLERRGVNATVEPNPWLVHYHRVRRPLPPSPPAVAIVIPTRDRVGILRTCIESVLRLTEYPDYRIVIVDNGSREPETHSYFRHLRERLSPDRLRVVDAPGEFNYSSLNNLAVREAGAPLLCLLNNDTEAREPGWLAEMVSHALRPEVGAVGARLVYPDGSLQHGGVVIGLGRDRTAGHAHSRLSGAAPGYFGRARLTQQFSAVTAACTVLRREVFEAVGGFDEACFAVNFNDVDLCLRVRTRGWVVVWTPFAELCHHESYTRGHPRPGTPEGTGYGREVENFQRRHGAWIAHDPAYNPNLSLDHPDFSFRAPPGGN